MSSGLSCLLFIVFGFCFGLWLAYEGTRKFRLLQKIENTATSKVDSAAIGLVELYGKALCSGGMKSPISGERCAYWCIVGQYYRRGKGAHWKEIFRRYSSVPFHLEDATGRILVDPENAQMAIPPDRIFNGYISGKGAWGEYTEIDPLALDYVNSLDEPGKKAFTDRSGEEIRIFEFYIAEGDRVYVLGDAIINAGAASPKSHENLIIRKKDVMYISDSHEKKIGESLRNEIKWNVFGGVALSMACAAILVWIILAYTRDLG